MILEKRSVRLGLPANDKDLSSSAMALQHRPEVDGIGSPHRTNRGWAQSNLLPVITFEALATELNWDGTGRIALRYVTLHYWLTHDARHSFARVDEKYNSLWSIQSVIHGGKGICQCLVLVYARTVKTSYYQSQERELSSPKDFASAGKTHGDVPIYFLSYL